MIHIATRRSQAAAVAMVAAIALASASQPANATAAPRSAAAPWSAVAPASTGAPWATPMGTPTGTSLTTQETAIATAVFNLLNSERKSAGLAPLRMNASLVRSAHAHDLTMAKYNTLSHQLPGEAVFSTRITSAGYRWSSAGENVGWNGDRSQNGAIALEKMMFNETAPNNGHRLNILSRTFKDVGIDILLESRTGKLWMTQDFASPR